MAGFFLQGCRLPAERKKITPPGTAFHVRNDTIVDMVLRAGSELENRTGNIFRLVNGLYHARQIFFPLLFRKFLNCIAQHGTRHLSVMSF